MEGKPRCNKCGRILTSPASIARGMGGKCAGIAPTTSTRGFLQNRSFSGFAYLDTTPIRPQIQLDFNLPQKRQMSRRELFRKQKEERRRLFETHLPFECGVILTTRKPLIYTPLENGYWQVGPSGRIISHGQLQVYLKRYQLI